MIYLFISFWNDMKNELLKRVYVFIAHACPFGAVMWHNKLIKLTYLPNIFLRDRSHMTGLMLQLSLLLEVLQVRQYSNLSWEYNFANSGS